MGNGSVIKPGDVQYMSAGTGVAHSEFNARTKFRAHVPDLDVPDTQGHTPAYDQSMIQRRGKAGKAAPGGFARRPRRLRESPPGQ